jgi:hypothetical protein
MNINITNVADVRVNIHNEGEVKSVDISELYLVWKEALTYATTQTASNHEILTEAYRAFTQFSKDRFGLTLTPITAVQVVREITDYVNSQKKTWYETPDTDDTTSTPPTSEPQSTSTPPS